MTEVIDGNAVAEEVREGLRGAIETLTDVGHRPGLATVLMSEDGASATYVSMKQRDCEELGIQSFHVEVDVDAPAQELYDTVTDLNENDEVDGILVQHPVADHVDYEEVVRRIDPGKDVDGFHPKNVGRLVRGDPRFRPCTPHGVQVLLENAGVETGGADAVVVGRSNIVGKPLANLLARKADDGNATVTLCHSRTRDLAAKTREADIVVAAAGVPELVDGSMLSEGATVIDVGYNRVNGEAVGDVAYESATEVAGAITPVPGGVGPMTRAMLMYNTVKAASQRSGVESDLPY
jgi:methylenetetrahydrofolate dehydrogenase (NADP+)/methenyltetrahydrofolate cyclohydrolase